MQDPRKENQNAMAHSSFAILKRIENQPMQGIAPLACLLGHLERINIQISKFLLRTPSNGGYRL